MNTTRRVLIHADPRMIKTPGGMVHSAKWFPLDTFWNPVVAAYPNYEWIQIGMQGDWIINDVKPKFGLSFAEIIKLAETCDKIICVDSFLQHLLAPSKRQLIVLWSRSDPEIFGYKHNINLLLDRAKLRPDQFGIWEACPYDPTAFISPQILIDLLK